MTATSVAWESPQVTSARIGRNVTTLLKALATGQLHGHQRVPRGKWVIDPLSADVWVSGGGDGKSVCRGWDHRSACLCAEVG